MSNVGEEFVKELQRAVGLINEAKYPEAANALNSLIDISPNLSQAMVQRGRCHWEMVRWEEALRDFRMAAVLNPHDKDVLWTISLLLLQMGRFSEGWKDLGVRWQSSRFDSARLHTTKPEWTVDRWYNHLLVWSEQGIGDQILYSSLLPAVKGRGEKLTVMVDARLMSLMQRGMPGIDFVPQTARLKGLDYHIPIGSVPAQFIQNYANIPSNRAVNFLKADPERVEQYRKKINKQDGEFVIGLSWGSGAKVIGNHKSAELEELLPIFTIPNTRLINMQYGQPYGPINELERKTGVRVESIHEVDNTYDLDGLAAAMECCDLIISVSNATAHLAGGLGRPTFLLNSNKLWFWSHKNGNQSLWYPSVTIFDRKNAVAPWTPQVEAIANQVRRIRGLPLNEAPPTFVFFHIGPNLTQPRRLVDSIRRTNPDAEIIMCSDQSTPFMLGISQRVHVKGDPKNIMQMRLDGFAAAKLNKPAIYLDTDMAVMEKISPTQMLGDHDVIMCRRSFQREALFNTNLRGMNFSEYQGKTLDQVYPYLACATVTRSYHAWEQMATILRYMDPKYAIWYGDQEALKSYAAANSIGTLDEKEYACLPEFVDRSNPPKIIHYKGNRK